MDVRILGALEVSDAGRAVDLGLRQARTLFAVLALHPGSPVRTSRIAEALWPEGPPARWEAAVQSHVSRLRRALEPDRPARAASTRISTRGDSYTLHLSDDEIDARRFELLAEEGRAALARAEHDRAEELLGLALREWRGPVVADDDDLAPLASEVGRLDELRALAGEDRAEAALALGNHGSAVADLESLVAEHPLRERGWELLLLALYRSGRQGEALRRYQELRRILVDQLGIEPGPSLRTLEGAILRQEADLVPRRAVPTAVAPAVRAMPAWLRAPDDAFVGRGSELDALRSSFRRGAHGDRRLVLVTGEPGIGKTRLVREACQELHAEGALVLGGRCIEEPLHVLQPFAEAIDHLAGAQGERLARDAPDDAAALAGLVPSLSQQAGRLPAVDAETRRYILFRAVGNLLDANALQAPLVLVLDDLQWAVHESVHLLAHLLRDDDRGPLLVIATARDTEPNPLLDALVADLRRERRLDRLRLCGLGPAEVQELASARGSTQASPALFSMTEGNPFYVEELVRHVSESGGALDAGTLPESVRDTVARRLLRLPAEARRLLGVAAVAGSEFRLDVLARAAEVEIDAADDALSLAARAGVVGEQAGRPGVYHFSHALIQTVLRDGLGAARRARVHRRVGEAADDIDGPGIESAHHLLAAAGDGSDVLPGIEAALSAAKRAASRHTYDDSVTILRAAWRALSTRSESDPVLVCRVAVELAASLRRSGNVEERAPLLEEAWARARATDDDELLGYVLDEGCSGTVVPAEPWVSRAELISARLDEESGRRIVLTAILSRARSGEAGGRARQLGEWALARTALVDPVDRRGVIAFCISAVGPWSPVERVIDLARSALGAARDSDDPVEVALALSTLRIAWLGAGDLLASDSVASEYEELVQAVRIPRYMAGVEQRRAMRALLAGRFVEAEAHANEAIRLQPTPEFIEALAVQVFALRFEQGRLGEVREAVEAWAARNERPAWQIGLSALLAESGETTAAAAALDMHSASGFESVPRDDLYFLSLGAAATTAVLTRDREAAGVLYELLSPHSARVIVAAEGALCWGSIHRFLGPLSAALGNVERASMHFEAAMSVHERLGALPFLARDRLAYAAFMRSTGGDPVRIESLARTGLALAAQLGMHSVVERYEDAD